jgi:CubicO group peptidase (beta-lactamase class C family)
VASKQNTLSAGASRVAHVITRQIASGGYDGAAVIGLVRGEIALEHYAGAAGPDLPAGPDVLWPIASVSKMYAVSTILALVEQGHVTLNMRVCDVLPSYTGGMREEVRLRHLLTHTGGLVYESPEMEARLMAHAPLDGLIDEMLASPLQFKPGTSVAYADNHTLLASHLIAKLMGRPFDALVHEHTLVPMGLNDTFFPTPAREDHRTATVRGPVAVGTSGAMYNSRHARSLAHPAFAVTSTARDLARFLSHFAPGGPRIHSKATVAAMSCNQTGLSAFGSFPGILAYEQVGPRPWGYGWALQTTATTGTFSDLASLSTFGHGGASGCQAFVDPDNDLAVVILTNTHLRTGFEAWFNRLTALSNVVVAALCKGA